MTNPSKVRRLSLVMQYASTKQMDPQRGVHPGLNHLQPQPSILLLRAAVCCRPGGWQPHGAHHPPLVHPAQLLRIPSRHKH
ncbi:uncharacterized protein MONOS_13551 [Monocercomonoides exilis]|uniref:uncharacterized protein n=1 Tax=Monocercomonoides exilis TaxID=2049356 RepID=UPI00355AA189|nr:hypothetical protein MONOS_13551 [Monocercomonoides exilis]|eukprot:MONOS_13551.1-p1 / transcript=MONOS_13551.1 / gene=MONOS_13551 / organism=Monocercomonoides_exilis_PA203 / gene_product=unspecified product / transcript_product=unspecified product / location=Mono_scaffold00843:24593-24982(-) / protein_length=81 / sequence_SO=supercontig / SO=protein_coding / is_pseudo=false